MSATAQDIPPRKTLREWVQPFEHKHAGKAYAIFIIDYLVFIAASIGAVVIPLSALPAKLLCAAIIGLWIARLFIIGHDACHGAYVASRRQNRWIGKLAFLPSLTPYRWWEIGHNMAHHGFGNLTSKDHVWIPFSAAEYAALSVSQKLWYRCTRSLIGAGPYYMVKWWSELFRLKSTQPGKLEPDTVLAATFAMIWIGALVLLSMALNKTVWINLLFAFVLPFIVWNYIMGLVIYLHHTHPDVRWYNSQEAWIASKPYITATVHVRFPQWVSSALHHIMEHPAHHLNTTIPLYNLRAAQRRLEDDLGNQIVVQPFSFVWYLNCVRTCKLYDFERGCWVGF